MSEAFVKTIKRDYVYVSDCYSAEVTMKLLEAWIKDYNTVAPHSGLGMRSPVEYRKNETPRGKPRGIGLASPVQVCLSHNKTP